jgi:hypothetical protein
LRASKTWSSDFPNSSFGTSCKTPKRRNKAASVGGLLHRDEGPIKAPRPLLLFAASAFWRAWPAC